MYLKLSSIDVTEIIDAPFLNENEKRNILDNKLSLID